MIPQAALVCQNFRQEVDIFQNLNDFLELLPRHPGAFNDTAQAFRLQKKDEQALESLNKAIELSGGEGSVACQAFLQRALLKQVKLDEKGALADFEKAASLGSEFASSQVFAPHCSSSLNSSVDGKT